jgi:hypothetical protein
MKILMVAALLAGLAAPALAEDAATPPPPQAQTQAALSPSQEGPASTALPQSKPVEVVPMSTMLDSNGPPPSRGGCHHGSEQVYLTN